ncbi:hypothetical protein PIB30_075915 [Stylosanthes scabra]|uniref:TF-B3 domain-containing protein n=1 Tax=Stylosanthes scabra TaxID=79078 RepID=A0ABU6VR36_9FABA|nr:hypothetical protein [Stylosanthes scabra]
MSNETFRVLKVRDNEMKIKSAIHKKVKLLLRSNPLFKGKSSIVIEDRQEKPSPRHKSRPGEVKVVSSLKQSATYKRASLINDAIFISFGRKRRMVRRGPESSAEASLALRRNDRSHHVNHTQVYDSKWIGADQVAQASMAPLMQNITYVPDAEVPVKFHDFFAEEANAKTIYVPRKRSMGIDLNRPAFPAIFSSGAFPSKCDHVKVISKTGAEYNMVLNWQYENMICGAILTGGWSEFVQRNHIRVGDVVTFSVSSLDEQVIEIASKRGSSS